MFKQDKTFIELFLEHLGTALILLQDRTFFEQLLVDSVAAGSRKFKVAQSTI